MINYKNTSKRRSVSPIPAAKVGRKIRGYESQLIDRNRRSRSMSKELPTRFISPLRDMPPVEDDLLEDQQENQQGDVLPFDGPVRDRPYAVANGDKSDIDDVKMEREVQPKLKTKTIKSKPIKVAVKPTAAEKRALLKAQKVVKRATQPPENADEPSTSGTVVSVVKRNQRQGTAEPAIVREVKDLAKEARAKKARAGRKVKNHQIPDNLTAFDKPPSPSPPPEEEQHEQWWPEAETQRTVRVDVSRPLRGSQRSDWIQLDLFLLIIHAVIGCW